ncbi:MAG: hypothetical protein ABI374_08640 [Ginsengibacter sp.]
MKLFFTSLLILSALLSDTPSFYQFNVVNLEGKSISCAAFKGRKVLIAVSNATNPSMSLLNYLSSLQQALPKTLAVIVIPTTDFNSGINANGLKAVQSRLNILITQPVKVKKQEGQSELVYWLTHFGANSHFDNNANGEGQVFLINEKGILYGVLSSGVPNDVIGQLINQNVKE